MKAFTRRTGGPVQFPAKAIRKRLLGEVADIIVHLADANGGWADEREIHAACALNDNLGLQPSEISSLVSELLLSGAFISRRQISPRLGSRG